MPPRENCTPDARTEPQTTMEELRTKIDTLHEVGLAIGAILSATSFN